MVKIVVCAIVKNESKIIQRCLNCCLSVADAICISDTGSTDNTVELIEKFGKEHNLLTKVPTEKFKDFGFNRSQSFLEAKKFIKDSIDNKTISGSLNEWYALLPDADMSFVNKKLKSITLDKPGYSLIQKTDDLDYDNTRLLRLSEDWTCVGRTHEYWSCKDKTTEKISIDICYFDDYNDGGCKADKYERDIRLLTLDMNENPKSDRPYFYIAQSYECIHDYDKAIEFYKKHNELESQAYVYKWMVYYRLGKIYEHLYNVAKDYEAKKQKMKKQEMPAGPVGAEEEQNQLHRDEVGDLPFSYINFEDLWSIAMKYYTICYMFGNKERSEPYYKIANHYYDVDKKLSYEFALIAANTPYPVHNCLFIEKSIYYYEADRIVSIQGFYGGDKEISRKHANLLTIKKNVPEHLINNSYENIQYYDNKLITTFDKKIEFPSDCGIKLEEGFNSCNPSICRGPSEGYFCICRSVNFTIDEKGNYQIKNNDWTKQEDINYLVIYDNSFNIKYVTKLDHENTMVKKDKKETRETENVSVSEKKRENINEKRERFNHIEDCRIFTYKGDIYFSSTYMDNTFQGTPKRIALYKIKSGKIIHLKDFDMYQDCEKNWLPFVDVGESEKINFMYSNSRILVLNENYEPKDKFVHENEKYNINKLRGGSGPVKLKSGDNLCINHEVYFKGNFRYYYHRFIILDKDFKVKNISRIFTFKNLRIEFCAGMCKNHTEDGVILTYGAMDSQAYICEVKFKEIDKLFIL